MTKEGTEPTLTNDTKVILVIKGRWIKISHIFWIASFRDPFQSTKLQSLTGSHFMERMKAGIELNWTWKGQTNEEQWNQGIVYSVEVAEISIH